jgi:hypothetical protein
VVKMAEEKKESEEISEEDIKILYDLAEYITNAACDDIEENYDDFFDLIKEKDPTMDNYEDIIDELLEKVDKTLDNDVSYFGFNLDPFEDILKDWGFSDEEVKDFLKRHSDTIAYMYQHDFVFLLGERLKFDVREYLFYKENELD